MARIVCTSAHVKMERIVTPKMVHVFVLLASMEQAVPKFAQLVDMAKIVCNCVIAKMALSAAQWMENANAIRVGWARAVRSRVNKGVTERTACNIVIVLMECIVILQTANAYVLQENEVLNATRTAKLVGSVPDVVVYVHVLMVPLVTLYLERARAHQVGEVKDVTDPVQMGVMGKNAALFVTAQQQMTLRCTIHLLPDVTISPVIVVVHLDGQDQTVQHRVLQEDGDLDVTVNAIASMMRHAIVSQVSATVHQDIWEETVTQLVRPDCGERTVFITVSACMMVVAIRKLESARVPTVGLDPPASFCVRSGSTARIVNYVVIVKMVQTVIEPQVNVSVYQVGEVKDARNLVHLGTSAQIAKKCVSAKTEQSAIQSADTAPVRQDGGDENAIGHA